MASLTIKNNSYEPVFQRQQGQGVNYSSTKIIDQSGTYAELGKFVDKGMQIIAQREEADETERVLLAGSRVTKRLADLKLEIETNMQGSNAKNAKALYDQQSEAIIEEEYGKSGIKYKAGEKMFRRNAITTATRGSVWAGEWESNQVEEARKTLFGLAVDDDLNNIISGAMGLQETYMLAKAKAEMLFPAMPKEKKLTLIKGVADKYAQTLVSAAINRNDYETANNIYEYLSSDMSSNTRATLSNAIYKNQEYSEDTAIADALVKANISNPEEARMFIQNNFGGKVKAGFEAFMQAVGMQESGGSYNAVNGRTGASGKYQIMPDNWAAWASEAGLKSDAEQTPENQERVARHKLKQYYEAYGAEGALVAWYAGPANGERWKNGASDAVDANGNHYSWDAKQGNGDEPSIKEYVQSSIGHIGRTNGIGLSAIRMDKIIALAGRMQADIARKQKAESAALFDGAIDVVYKMSQQGLSYAEAREQIRVMAGQNYKLGAELEKAAKFYWGTNDGKASAATVNKLNDMLADGQFNSKEEFLEYAKLQNFNADQLYEANKTYNKYQAGEGVFGYKLDNNIKFQIVGDINDSAAKAQAWEGVTPLLREWIQEELTKNKHTPTVYEIVEKGRELIQKKPVGYVTNRGLLWDSKRQVNISEADYARSGIRNAVEIGDDLFRVDFVNGSSEIMNAAKLETITR